MKKFALLFQIVILSACLAQPIIESTPTPNIPLLLKQDDNPYAPQPQDSVKTQAGVILTSLDLSERSDLNPAQTELIILGSMPSVCNELRVNVNPPDNTYRVFVEIYSIMDPKLKCDNVFQQFKTTLLLGVYSAGQYSLWVNDAFVGNFVAY